MPHQCVRCGKLYKEASDEILKGCGDCGGKFFFFISDVAYKKRSSPLLDITIEDRQKIEEDVMDIVSSKLDKDKPVILDIESINILQPGKYELDIVELFKKNPLIWKLEEGKYIIDLSSAFDAAAKG
jgi:predicted  nucleic acid-binding Zn-ribbon protein